MIPLREDEAAEWLAVAGRTLHAPAGRLLVCGGFDDDILAAWRDTEGPDRDGHGVLVVPFSTHTFHPGRHGGPTCSGA